MTWHRPNSPAGRITSPFGPRGPIAGAPDASTYHLGVDLRAGSLTVPADVYAAAAGTVRRIYKTPLGAWVLELDHGDGVRTRYVHMQRAGIHVVVGGQVTGGQHVADASNSGAPTVHLHFEVLIGGRQIDPVPWLQARGVDLTVTTTTSGTDTTTGLTPGTPIAIPTITATASEEDIMTIFRATGYGLGALQSQGAWAILSSEEEKKNLIAAGAREVWVEKQTLDALIKDQRGQYASVAVRK